MCKRELTMSYFQFKHWLYNNNLNNLARKHIECTQLMEKKLPWFVSIFDNIQYCVYISQPHARVLYWILLLSFWFTTILSITSFMMAKTNRFLQRYVLRCIDVFSICYLFVCRSQLPSMFERKIPFCIFSDSWYDDITEIRLAVQLKYAHLVLLTFPIWKADSLSFTIVQSNEYVYPLISFKFCNFITSFRSFYCTNFITV